MLQNHFFKIRVEGRTALSLQVLLARGAWTDPISLRVPYERVAVHLLCDGFTPVLSHHKSNPYRYYRKEAAIPQHIPVRGPGRGLTVCSGCQGSWCEGCIPFIDRP